MLLPQYYSSNYSSNYSLQSKTLIYVNLLLNFQPNNQKSSEVMLCKPSLKKKTPLSYFKQFKQQMESLKDEVESFNKWEDDFYKIDPYHSENIQSHNHEQNGDIVKIKPSTILMKNKKAVLKKLTEPRYHKNVVDHLTEKENEWALNESKEILFNKTKSIRKVMNAWIENANPNQFLSSNKQVLEANSDEHGLKKQSCMPQILPACLAPKLIDHDQNNSESSVRSSIRTASSQSKIRISKAKVQRKLEKQWDKTVKYRAAHNITQHINTEGSSYCLIGKKNKKQKSIIDKVKLNRLGTSVMSYYSRMQSEGINAQSSDLKQFR